MSPPRDEAREVVPFYLMCTFVGVHPVNDFMNIKVTIPAMMRRQAIRMPAMMTQAEKAELNSVNMHAPNYGNHKIRNMKLAQDIFESLSASIIFATLEEFEMTKKGEISGCEETI